ncbi:sensor histidine kinase [Nocardiopsis sediminis]|uniref:histidine kinase n=1 Tax=Nocardiopsis sediminis TaxID=1778267 RepID=A0ABV8FVP9_9ACTN
MAEPRGALGTGSAEGEWGAPDGSGVPGAPPDPDVPQDARRISRVRVGFAAGLAVLAVLGGVFGALVLPGADPVALAVGTAAQVLVSMVVLADRKRPVTATLAIVAVSLLLFTTDPAWSELARAGGVVWIPLALAWAGSNLVREARSPLQWAVGGLALAVYVVVAGVLTTPAGGSVLYSALGAMAPVLGGTVVSLSGRLRRARRDRIAQEARERELLAERTRIEERRRLAAEMHDAVTHQVSLMVLQAGALGVATADPRVRAAADDIRSAGSRAIAELRDIIGVLRDDRAALPAEHPDAPPAAGAPDPVPDVADLVAQSRSVGLPVELAVSGDPGGMAPHVARAVHRIVQEALTNVRKHAPGAATRVDLRYRTDGVLVGVASGPAAADPDPLLAAGGSGAGLAGLRQRVELLGGTLNAEPTSGGGFQVNAILPNDTTPERKAGPHR